MKLPIEVEIQQGIAFLMDEDNNCVATAGTVEDAKELCAIINSAAEMRTVLEKLTDDLETGIIAQHSHRADARRSNHLKEARAILKRTAP